MRVAATTKFDLGERVVLADRSVAQVKAVHVLQYPEYISVKYHIETPEGKIDVIPEEDLYKVGEYIQDNSFVIAGKARGWLL